MFSNKKGTGILVGLLTFIVAKVILENIGISSISAPIIIGLIIVCYTMFVVGVDKKQYTKKEKSYFIACASSIAIAFISAIVVVIFMSYYPQQFSEHGEILVFMGVIYIVAIICTIFAAYLFKKSRNS